jgi:hypothetical protein
MTSTLIIRTAAEDTDETRHKTVPIMTILKATSAVCGPLGWAHATNH